MIASLRGGVSGGGLLPSPSLFQQAPMVTTYFSLLSPLRLLFLLSSVPLSWLVPSVGSACHFFLRILVQII